MAKKKAEQNSESPMPVWIIFVAGVFAALLFLVAAVFLRVVTVELAL